MKELKYLDITKTDQGHIKVPSVVEMYPDMGAGRAEAIVTNIHDTDLVPYVFRKTPYRSTRETDKLVGASVSWNQLAKGTSFANRNLTLGLTITKSTGNNSIIVNGTASATNNLYFWQNLPVVAGHKYFVQGAHNHGGNNGFSFNNVAAKDTGNGVIFQAESSATHMQFFFTSGDSFTNEKFYPQLFDLTVALGSTIADYIYGLESGTAGAGVAKLREWGFFDKPYYAYNAGAIESVNVSKHKMTGLNQFDEVWEDGCYDGTDGSAQASTVWERNKNAVKCLPNTSYYLKQFGGTGFGNIVFYDGAGNFVSSVSGGSVASGYTFTTPTNVYQIKFYRGKTNNSGKPVCLNLSNPSVNGQYAPYELHEYPLADITLRGILKLDGSNNLYADGDVYEADGSVTRKYGVVDLGTLDWDKSSSGTGRFAAAFPSALAKYKFSNSTAMVCSNYVFDGVGNTASGNTYYGANGTFRYFWANATPAYEIYIVDESKDSMTAAQFKTAMGGVYLVYELATPTTETADPYTNPQVCSPYGTEEYVDRAVAAGTRDVSIPVGHSTEYTKDIVGAIEGIPFPPSANGNYKLRVSVSSGVPTYSWVSE